MLKKVILAVLLAAMLLLMAGCQTVAGVGRDITWSAEATSNFIEGN